MGLPLAKACLASNIHVKGSTTSKEKLPILINAGIDAYLLQCGPQIQSERLADFFNVSTLFVNLPFKRSFDNPAIYKEQISSIIDCVKSSSVDWIIFASSTSVYPPLSGIVDESRCLSFADDRAGVLLDIEQMIMNIPGKDANILRFAGLIGPGRNPGRFLSGKEKVSGASSPVNLVHLDDCVAIIMRLLDVDCRNEIFNVCADKHPAREAFYAHASALSGLPPPKFAPDNGPPPDKIIDNSKVKKYLKYNFKYPNPSEAVFV